MSCAFLDRYSDLDSPVHRLDARVKIVAFIALVVSTVTTPASAVWVFVGYFALVWVYILLSRVPLRYVFTRSLVVIPFVLLVAAFAPFIQHGGGSYSFGIGGLKMSQTGLLVVWNCTIKSYIAVLSIIALSSTTAFPDLLKGVERLGAPRIMIVLLSFAYRYIFVLVDEAMRLKRACESRAFAGRWLWQTGVIGHMIGSLFLRSYERGERVYLAMVSRGFDGRIVGATRRSLRAVDVAFLLFTIIFIIALRLGLQ